MKAPLVTVILVGIGLLLDHLAFADGARVFSGPREDFVFQIEDAHIGHATGEVLREFAEEVGLGVVLETRVVEGRPLVVDRNGRPLSMIAEWGYSGIRLGENEIDGAGLPRKGFPCFSSLQGCEDPKTKEEAYARMKAYFEARRAYQQAPGSWLGSMNGHYYFHHYAAEWGADLLLSEVGENINGTQAHIAFTRGAARQYGKPWGMDMSAWYGPSINDYWAEADRVWCERRDAAGNCVSWHSGPDHGHSLSLFERIYYTSYMAGAQLLVAEAGSVYFLNSRHAPAALSPLGEVARAFHQFTREHPDRGTPYVPVALVLDRLHGLGLGSWYVAEGKEVTWDKVPATPGDLETLAVLEALWPKAFEVMGRDESEYLVATPIGDTVDVLLEDAPLEVLRLYPILVFSGDIHWEAGLQSRVLACLEVGSTVVIGGLPVHAPLIEALGLAAGEEVQAVGKGKLIQVREREDWPGVLQDIAGTWPVRVEGPVQYLLNQRGKAWVLTLINNAGITKQPREATQVDPARRVEVVVRGQSQALIGATAWKSREMVKVDGGELRLTLDPGEIAVIELALKALVESVK